MDLQWFQERASAIGAALDEGSGIDPRTGQAKPPTEKETAAKVALLELAAVFLHDVHTIAQGLAPVTIQGDGILKQRVEPRGRD